MGIIVFACNQRGKWTVLDVCVCEGVRVHALAPGGFWFLVHSVYLIVHLMASISV